MKQEGVRLTAGFTAKLDVSLKVGSLTETITVSGAARPLPAGVALALYRAAQEALSNARKHAPGASVSLCLTFNAATTVLRVTNGPSRAVEGNADLSRSGSGFGLQGMRERVEVLGGEILAEPHERGFTVRVAVIQSKQDLGADPELFAQPQLYARFLDAELRSAWRRRRGSDRLPSSSGWIVLMDLRMPRVDGCRRPEVLRADHPTSRSSYSRPTPTTNRSSPRYARARSAT